MHTLEQLRSGALAGTRRLDLSCGLTEVPDEVFALADTLEVLNLSGNRLRDFPHQLSQLHKLQVLFASDNEFEVLPEVLGDCPALQMVGFKANRIAHVPAASLPPALRWLTLTDNAIGHLPTELGRRPALQKLMLAGNQLTGLPDSLQAAQKLELLRVSANRLGKVPGWLTELPRLSWLALAGNALGWVCPAGSDLPGIAWPDLTHGPLLGEGASGHIHRVLATDWPHALALKLFKGAVTSDGLPEDELAACLAAGQHPSLTTPVARLTDHPTQAQGLLMPLIPAAHINLAGPPSLQSCTRDVYPPGFQLSSSLALGIAHDVAHALAHLHQRGVMHGDLYAHNILMDPVHGQARLGDFGAATRLPGDTPELRQSLLALEVRALGCLLEELALAVQPPSPASAMTPWHHESGTSSTADDSSADAAVQTLQALARACLSDQPRQRPTAVEVAQALQTLKP
ncbi:leucine-rich repeat-containing protein kinase family protein [Limnohabitans planktonicus]|uniref:Protein kinase n=1 Tax=Limnohabitans planktonicus II-D5 TaxID=1293045 RepID=A0A2T7UAS2_9BURK|nr:leucine-rich repeat-containing protein kinase family protein [Limnohabitans planktonicus]PVE41769.1 protein kinase [Limnohabitans planktonicus II-D5]